MLGLENLVACPSLCCKVITWWTTVTKSYSRVIVPKIIFTLL